MCGLIGFVNTKFNTGLSSAESKAFSELLYMDALRGDDATGVCAYLKDESYTLLKDNIPASNFITSLDWKQFPLGNSLTILGHNRKQTQGQNSPENAHPYHLHDRYVFFHNGTLTNWKTLVPDLKADVDSIVLGTMLTECEGNITKIEEVLEKITGAYAVMWLDMKLNKLYILRNYERTLFYGTTIFGYAFASEGAMLISALSRNGVKIENVKVFEVDTLYSIDLTDKTAVFKEEKLSIKKYTPPIVVTHMEATKEVFNLSKNVFKGIKKKWIGKKLDFWIDDYNELYPGNKNDDWFIFGNSEQLPFKKHTVRAIVKQMTEEAILTDWDGALLSGIVTDVCYDDKLQSLTFWVNGTKKLPSSIMYC